MGFSRFPALWKYDYPIAGYGTACISDDSNKAWGMLFESEAWPYFKECGRYAAKSCLCLLVGDSTDRRILEA